MAAKAVCVLRGDVVNGVVHFTQKVVNFITISSRSYHLRINYDFNPSICSLHLILSNSPAKSLGSHLENTAFTFTNSVTTRTVA